MKCSLLLPTIILSPLLLSIAHLPVASASSSACTRSAERMFKSCRFEIKEEFQATNAHCVGLSDPDERADCKTEAALTKAEDRITCGEQKEARFDACDLLQENRYDPDPLTGVSLTGEPINFIDPDTIGGANPVNPYLSLLPGHTTVLRAGEDFEELIIVHVTDEEREILGVSCRVVVDIVLLQEDDDYIAVEVTDDWFAQSTTGDVYYCGEIARNYEDGVLRDLDGSFEAGLDFAKSGVLIRAMPQVGEAHRQEYLLGEAEDIIQYIDTQAIPTAAEGGDNDSFPCNPGCLKTEESIPTEPESGEYKYYLPDIGFVLGVALEDGEITGERDELVCVGSSLDVLSTSECGLEDPEEVLEELCELSPDAFCEDD